MASFLRERLAPRDGDMAGRISLHLLNDRRDAQPLATLKGVIRIAIHAAQGTTGQPDKNCRQAHSTRLTLQREKNLADSYTANGQGGKSYLRVASSFLPFSAALLVGCFARS